MECLDQIKLDGTGIEELPESIENIKKLEILSLRGCRRFKSLPQSIWKLEYLQKLIICDCPNLQGKFPEILGVMEELYEIQLGGTGIEELPESFENVSWLVTLNLGGCLQIKFLPNSLCKLPNLRKFTLKECSSFEALPRLPLGLKKLNIQYCKSLKSIQQLPSSLTYFDAAGCTSLKTISSWEVITHQASRYLGKVFWRLENCLDLDQSTLNDIIAKTNLFHLINVYFSLPIWDLAPDIVYPGDEIPEGFNYATDDGNSINIKLPINWFKLYPRGLLFSICIVGVLNKFDDDGDDQSVDFGYFEESSDDDYLVFDDDDHHHHDERRRTVSLEYEFNFKTQTSNGDNGLYQYVGSYQTTIANTNNADHVFIMYDEYMCLGNKVLEQVFGPDWFFIQKSLDMQASFSVCFKEGVGFNLDIKKYGIGFIYDNVEPDVDSTSGESSFDYDYDEPNVDSAIVECSDQACEYQYTDHRSVTSADGFK